MTEELFFTQDKNMPGILRAPTIQEQGDMKGVCMAQRQTCYCKELPEESTNERELGNLAVVIDTWEIFSPERSSVGSMWQEQESTVTQQLTQFLVAPHGNDIAAALLTHRLRVSLPLPVSAQAEIQRLAPASACLPWDFFLRRQCRPKPWPQLCCVLPLVIGSWFPNKDPGSARRWLRRRQRNGGTERPSSLPKVTQLMSEPEKPTEANQVSEPLLSDTSISKDESF
nr:uncharacterized protein LOC131765788 [Kogia breviceps]